jgi:serpin B
LKVEKDMFLDNMGVKTEAALSIANKMYVKKGFPIEPPFSSALEKYFGASAQSVDFVDKATAGIINEWVEKQTNGKIKDLVKPGIC